MRLLVCGGRKFHNKAVVFATLQQLHGTYEFEWVITGGCSGADQLGKMWAKANNIARRTFLADWDDIEIEGAVVRYHDNGKPYNAIAGNMRNTEMLVEGKPDLVVAFPGGSGTADMVAKAKAAKVSVIEVKMGITK